MNSTQKIKNNSKMVWGASPAGSTLSNQKKGTKEFFEQVLHKRFSAECKWLFELVNFSTLKDKKVLEIGCGAGYDAYQFCKHGADYTGIDITPENIIISKKHLSYYGYTPTILEMDAEKLILDDTYDYVFSFGVLHHTPHITKALQEIYRVTKTNGTAQIIVYNKHSLFYIITLVLWDWFFNGKFFNMSRKERLSQIEFTTSSKKPLVNVYSKKELCSLMTGVGFTIEQVAIRKLLKEDLPDIPIVRRVYKYIPQSFLDWLGKYVGWYVSIKARKEY